MSSTLKYEIFLKPLFSPLAFYFTIPWGPEPIQGLRVSLGDFSVNPHRCCEMAGLTGCRRGGCGAAGTSLQEGDPVFSRDAAGLTSSEQVWTPVQRNDRMMGCRRRAPTVSAAGWHAHSIPVSSASLAE